MSVSIGRRQFISALGSTVVVWSSAARAQQPERMRRIGVLAGYAESDPQWKLNVAAFLHRLHELGWSDGQNLRIDYRFGIGDPSRIRNAATELVQLAPEVIICNSTSVVTALLHETKTIPIVFALNIDPVGSGLVSSLAKPGGNVTGFSGFEFEMTNKWLGTLKEIAPRLGRVMLMFNPDTASYFDYFLRPADEAAPAVGVEIIRTPVHDEVEIEHAFEAVARKPDGGLVVLPDIFTVVHREQIIALAAQYRLPSVYPYRAFAAGGGLMSYGFDIANVFGQSASYVDRILRGEKPANLPVQGPTKFDLVINLKTAKALNLTIPASVLARADEVIE